MKKLGRTIMALRKMKGWKPIVFANKIGVQRQHLWAIENGRAIPSGRLLVKIAEVLDSELIFTPNSELIFTPKSVCGECDGSGWIIKFVQPCRRCNETG